MPIVRKVRKLGGRPAFGGGAGRDTSSQRPAFAEKAAPCFLGCPNGTDVRAFLTTLALGEGRGLSADEAADAAFYVLADRNPFPATCGRLCAHHCEDDCNRAGHDEAIAVHEVERAIGDHAIARKLPLRLVVPARHDASVAVIGAGAAGLSAACQLARLGYAVSVFDAGAEPGGELLDAVGRELLPREVLDGEVARIRDLGVEFRPGTTEPGEGFALIIKTKAMAAFQPGALAAAIHFGRHAAQLADAELRGVSLARLAAHPRISREQVKFDHYGHAERPSVGGRSPTVAEAMTEARRCLGCGGCLECDNCWKYCPDQAVLKPLGRGEPYRFRLEFCQGCSKCAEQCPTGYIEMR